MWQGEEFPALWWPPSGLHPPAEEPCRATRIHGRPGVAVILRWGRKAVRPVPPRDAVHASCQWTSVPPLFRAWRQGRPGQVGLGDRAESFLCLCWGRACRTANSLSLERTEAQTFQWACRMPWIMTRTAAEIYLLKSWNLEMFFSHRTQ